MSNEAIWGYGQFFVVISCVCRIHDEFKTRICNGGTMMYFVDNLENEKALDLNA